MMIRGRLVILTGMVVGMLGCIDEFDPTIDQYVDLLVVDGGITNKTGPHTVRLSLTSPVSNPDYKPFPNAEVRIKDELGNIIPLVEKEPGTYQTDSLVAGEPGISYSIEITTEQGKLYRSEPELLRVPVLIDTVYHETVIRQEIGYDFDLYGYEFYVDTRPSNENESYFKWDLEATYHYQSDFTIRWYFDGTLHWFHGPDSLYNCWKSYNVGEIFTAGTHTLSEPVIKKYPFHFVSTQSRELSVRYSLLVKQRTISKSAFEYWEEVRKQNGEDPTLYATQPSFIRGNVSNVTDPGEMVVGYFMVSSMDDCRIFVDRPPQEVPMRYPICTLTEAEFQAYNEMGMMDPVFYPLYAIETPGGRRALPHQNCVDCRRKGGTIEKPTFWID